MEAQAHWGHSPKRVYRAYVASRLAMHKQNGFFLRAFTWSYYRKGLHLRFFTSCNDTRVVSHLARSDTPNIM